MTVRVTAEADTRQGAGHAVLRIEGAKVAPDGIRFLIRRPGYREDTLGPSGWQAAEAQLTPEAAYVAQGALTLHVGPEVVAHMEPGMNVAFWLALPDGTLLDGRLAWPAIPGPIGGAGARRGRMVATQRVANDPARLRTGGALVGDVVPQPRQVPPPVPAAPPEPPAPAPAPAPVIAAAPPPEPPREEPEEAPAAEDAADAAAEDAAAGAGGRRIDLRAERDQQQAAAAVVRRSPWGGRIAVTASIAVLLLAGAAAASVYLGRDQICASASFGELADDWGLCPPVAVAEAPPESPAEAPPADAPPAEPGDGVDWDSINPLTWLGPPPEADGSGPADDATRAAALEPQDSAPPAPPPPSPESQRALARQFLEGQPTPEAAFDRANELRAEGQVEAAFLIYRYAAERDLAAAAGAVAAMYDPETYTPESSPLPRPNATVARRWYERAVAAGDEEALISLARMLVAQNEVEEARAVLHQAEEAGLTEAASQILEELE